jgi:hypothetical protein
VVVMWNLGLIESSSADFSSIWISFCIVPRVMGMVGQSQAQMESQLSTLPLREALNEMTNL